jgi:hypothetical protein
VSGAIKRGCGGVVAVGLIEIIHGFYDGYSGSPGEGIGHTVAAYGPVAGAALYAGASNYTILKPIARILGAAGEAAIATPVAIAAYYSGKVIGAGIEKLL